MLREIVQLSFLIVVAGATLLVFVCFNSTLPKKRRNVFVICTLISLLMIVCNGIRYVCEGNLNYLMLLELSSAVSFTISGPVVLPFIFLSNVIHIRMRQLLYGFSFINMLLSFVSIFTKWYFYYDNEAVFHFGTYFYIPYYLTGMYLAILVAASYRKFRIGMHGEGAFLSMLSVAVLAAMILNSKFGYKFLISGMAVLCSVFYYLFFVTQTLTQDALTELFNRHMFYKDVERMKRQHMLVISMDLNGLKKINDTLGHDVGDQAILAVADVVREQLPAKCRCYRMGGDEFEILYPGADMKMGMEIARKLKAAVAEKSYSVAIGYREYQKDMDFDAVFREADAMMYDDKVQMKAQHV